MGCHCLASSDQSVLGQRRVTCTFTLTFIPHLTLTFTRTRSHLHRSTCCAAASPPPAARASPTTRRQLQS
eukprot:scaffold17824_cov39-Phaeocystis_antarctica.AAC.1